jgi:integrase
VTRTGKRVVDSSKLQKRFKKATKRAGLRPVRFHDLRHTFGTRMAAAGAPLRAIQEWMGHSDYRTTTIYADYAPDPTQGARYAAAAFSPPRFERPQEPEPPGPRSSPSCRTSLPVPARP